MLQTCFFLLCRLAGRHADCAVETNVLAVEIAVADQLERERGVFFRAAEARRVRNLCGEGGFDFLGCALQERGIEDAWQDGVDADQLLREVARDRQGHADDTALGGGIGRLSDLTGFGGDGGGVDDNAALAVDRIEREHPGGRLRDAAESADEVDLDDHFIVFERVVRDRPRLAVAGDRFPCLARTGAVDEDTFLTELRPDRREACIDLLFRGHIDFGECPAEFPGERLALFLVEVKDTHLDAVLGELAARRGAKSWRSASDNCSQSFEFHLRFLLISYPVWWRHSCLFCRGFLRAPRTRSFYPLDAIFLCQSGVRYKRGK